MRLQLESAQAMEEFGRRLGQHCPPGTHVHLQGLLGAGKTTLVRGFLRARGYRGKVKSPTYTLVEPYSLGDINIFHFDLYRLHGPEELEQVGFRDYFDGHDIVLVEWPENGATCLNEPDLRIVISILARGRGLEIQANSTKGMDLLQIIQ